MFLQPDSPNFHAKHVIFHTEPDPHLHPAGPVEKRVGRLEVAVDSLLAMQEGHARADISDDLALSLIHI